MGHRAALYSVVVHPVRKKDQLRPMGDIDEQGTYLGDVLVGILSNGLAVTNADDSKVVEVQDATLAGEYLDVLTTHGQNGVAAEIRDGSGALRIHQYLDDSQVLRCGSLFYLPRMETRGWWVVHVNNGRSAKGLMQSEIVSAFRDVYPKLMLKITPAVDASALDAAIAQNRVEKVKLVRLARPGDIAEAVLGEWVQSNDKARLELDISAYGAGRRVQAGLLRRYRSGHDRAAAFKKIVEFGGLRFDHAKVEIVLPNGDKRTFNIEDPEAGHAMTRDMTEIATDERGEPTPESIAADLRTSLDAMKP